MQVTAVDHPLITLQYCFPKIQQITETTVWFCIIESDSSMILVLSENVVNIFSFTLENYIVALEAKK